VEEETGVRADAALMAGEVDRGFELEFELGRDACA